MLDYVEGHSVIARLNEALDGAWSFEITHHEVREDEVVVLGKLSAEGIAKMQFGVGQLTREKGTGALVSLGDDLKAAATDALKKCATFLGVGLHLYAEKPIRPAGPPGGAPSPAAAARQPSPAESSPAAASRGGITPRQLDALARIARGQ